MIKTKIFAGCSKKLMLEISAAHILVVAAEDNVTMGIKIPGKWEMNLPDSVGG